VHTRRQAAVAAAAYLAITLAWTWPLAAGLTRDVPADFGDPLLNTWILAWDATHLGRGWWNANIFFPHPLTLAYSEHLLPQAVSILPLYAITRNPILCYNVVFLATFVLSGLGMFLLARELTGRTDAAFVAGLAFAFAPYRVASLPHVQVLSSAWMAFALYGFRRYFNTGHVGALAGGAAAWIVQNLSCGYYLFYFSFAMVAYLAWELINRRCKFLPLAIACGIVVLTTVPLLMPYLELRRLGFDARPLGEVERFSADVYAYATADPQLHIWGPIARGFPKPEGSLFPGLTILVLAAIAAAPPAALAPFALLVVPLLGVRMPLVRMTSVSRTLAWAVVLSAAIVIGSPDARRRLRAWLASPRSLLVWVVVGAIVLSFGPDIHSYGRQIAEWSAYRILYDHVPGFDGLRVPARLGMIVVFGMAALAALAVHSRAVATVAGTLILVESLAAPIPINQNDTNYQQRHLAALPDRVSADDKRDLYAYVAQLPSTAAIVELPLGEPAFDVRYMIASTRHWKPLVNGYSGGVPAAYGLLTQTLQDFLERGDRAWELLAATGATHAIVHEGSYADGLGDAVTAWLRSHGAREVAAFPADLAGGTSAKADRVLVLK
jgi:hypothetical protein